MTRRWCTTLTPGGGRERRDHDTLADAHARVDEVAGKSARLTVWFNDDDGTGWKSWDVIELHNLVRVL